MVTITIPKKFTNGKELVVVPKKDWEKLKKIAKMKISEVELEHGLKKALEDVKAGRLLGPFDSVEEFKKKYPLSIVSYETSPYCPFCSRI